MLDEEMKEGTGMDTFVGQGFAGCEGFEDRVVLPQGDNGSNSACVARAGAVAPRRNSTTGSRSTVTENL